MPLHRREILHETTLSGGGLDFYAQKKVVLRSRGRPTRQWVYSEDTAQRIRVAQELGKLGISLEDAATALNGATLEEIQGALSSKSKKSGDGAGDRVRAIITRAGLVPEEIEEEPAVAV